MDTERIRQCLALQQLLPLYDGTLSRLLVYFGSPEAVWQSDWRSWNRLGLTTLTTHELGYLQHNGCSSHDHRQQIDSWQTALGRVDARVIALTDDQYPRLLRTLYDPPPLLYLRGQVAALQQPLLAIVGSRRASAVGLRLAEQISAEVGSAGLGIASGLALGIDGAAHLGGLRAGAKGVAVMATGIDQVYPRRHQALAEQLLGNGCLVTELPPGMSPQRHHFPRRNRVISGLSLGVLVVEAALPSGSLITAGTAADQGREVFALPWSPLHRGGAGCLRLLRDGATMVQCVDDILAELGPLCEVNRELVAPVNSAEDDLEGNQRRLLQLLGRDAVTADELAIHSGLPVDRVLVELSVLELAGRVERSDYGYQRV